MQTEQNYLHSKFTGCSISVEHDLDVALTFPQLNTPSIVYKERIKNADSVSEQTSEGRRGCQANTLHAGMPTEEGSCCAQWTW